MVPNREPVILVVTGASGAGKTTLVRELEAAALPGVGCFYFDTIGVPSRDEMVSRWGGTLQWQRAATEEWLRRLARDDDAIRVAVLDGQSAPSIVLAAAQGVHTAPPKILLVDCIHAERNARLRARGQPELASPDMDCWAAYLRGQADALALPILDTTGRSVGDSAAELVKYVTMLMRRPDPERPSR